jgi:hypothetical protein
MVQLAQVLERSACNGANNTHLHALRYSLIGS